MLGLLKEPSLQKLEVGSPQFFRVQKELIARRPLLKWCYDTWYSRLREDVASVPEDGPTVELGSGGSYLKELEEDLITSDVVEGVAEQVIDARELPFEEESLQAIVLTHVLHHIPDVEAFFQEAQRTLQPGGVISMIEVAHTPFARFFFGNFHPEPYDSTQKEWNFEQEDSMADSNQALSWIVLQRDRNQFEKLFPDLEIECFHYTPWLTYLLSGGVTMRDPIPAFLTKPLCALEKVVAPLSRFLALHWHIRIRKRPATDA